MPRRPQRIETLLAWLRARGAVFPKIEVICRNDDSAIVMARERLEPGEFVIELPWSCVLTPNDVRQGLLVNAVATAGIEADEHTQIALYLLEQRTRENSPWRAYVDALPQTYDTMPIFYDAERLAYLQGSYALDAALGRNRRYRHEYARIRAAVADHASFSLEQYRWARTAVHTRCFRVGAEKHKDRVMLPLIDLVDHDLSGSAAWGLREPVEGVACWARTVIEPGEEIRLSYGARPLSRHFIAYGFLNSDRRYDDARIVLLLDPTDPLLAEKRKLLPAARRNHYFVGHQFDAAFREVLTVARLIHLTDLDDAACAAIQGCLPVSLDNERAAVEEVLNACGRALALFPTSVGEDGALLRTLRAPEEETIRAAVEFTMREKQVLEAHVSFLTAVLGILRLDTAARRQRIASLPAHAALQTYFAEARTIV